MNDRVSILVPVFNRESIIGETLNSALSQSYENIEVVVVDNASTDNTWKIIEGFANNDNRVRAFRNKSNIGPVRNWRRCVEEATGFYAKILWSDDLISHDFIEKCLPLMNSETAFVYSGVKIFTERPENGLPCYFIGNTGHKSSSEFLTRALLDNNVPVSPGCAIFRLEDLKKNLLVDVRTKVDSNFSMHAIGNDLLLFLLTAKNYPKFGFVAEPLSFFRAHADSISISSEDGKLPIHYMLVRAYFAEHYQKDMVSQMAARAWLLIIKYPAHRSFGIERVSDFFYYNVKLNYYLVILILFNRLLRIPARIFRKMYRMLEAKK
ncbi:glycosyltransferase family 2 protein [Marinobacter gelidimuriae]|uniref:glycosyltransferase family 2 protein n=1 Tax=Marinobacter gelidimuriae TaxID=2739064 RepID=UPI00037D9AD4|nr:glycosyltransferase family 2 protein [Marinobacter gelidimuriae]